MTRPLRVGDRVTLTATVSGIRHDGVYVNLPDGGESWCRANPDSLTLITPAEPPVGSVVVKDGKAYVRLNTGDEPMWDHFGDEPIGDHFADGSYTPWDHLSDGDVIFTPGGE